METEYLLDEEFGERLLISINADKSELGSNIRAARAILRSYDEISIRINPHTYAIGHKIVVIDLDEHVMHLDSFSLSKYISRRKSDFTSCMITDCYVVFYGKAVRVNARYQTRREIETKLETLRP